MKTKLLFKFITCLFLFFGLISNLHAQLENVYWYFGNQAGLDFNDGTLPPTVLSNGATTTQGSTASVSDSNGNLLFYTDGISVWNNADQLMPNGSGLLGDSTISQSVIAVPNPSDANKFYVFTNSGQGMGTGLFYSSVDMSADNGSGDVDAAQKNTLLNGAKIERLTAIKNLGENSYWLVLFGSIDSVADSDTFYTYKIDATGINLVSQTAFTFPYPPNTNHTEGQMKISADSQSLAMTYNLVDEDPARFGILNAQSVFLYDFDGTTGIVSASSNFIVLNENILASYGLEFSPDSNLLYFSVTHERTFGPPFPDVEVPVNKIYQIEYRSGMVQVLPTLLYDDTVTIYGLQTALDGKIYATNSNGSLSVINLPNIVGAGANFVNESIDLSPGIAAKELPQLVPDIFVGSTTSTLPKKPIILGNPFNEELKFKFKFIQTYTIEFYSSAGSLAKTVVYDDMTNRKIYKVDTSDLPTDTYYLIIRDQQSQIWYETTVKIQ